MCIDHIHRCEHITINSFIPRGKCRAIPMCWHRAWIMREANNVERLSGAWTSVKPQPQSGWRWAWRAAAKCQLVVSMIRGSSCSYHKDPYCHTLTTLFTSLAGAHASSCHMIVPKTKLQVPIWKDYQPLFAAREGMGTEGVEGVEVVEASVAVLDISCDWTYDMICIWMVHYIVHMLRKWTIIKGALHCAHKQLYQSINHQQQCAVIQCLDPIERCHSSIVQSMPSSPWECKTHNQSVGWRKTWSYREITRVEYRLLCTKLWSYREMMNMERSNSSVVRIQIVLFERTNTKEKEEPVQRW